MRSVVESKKIILKGDTTTTGGEVLTCSIYKEYLSLWRSTLLKEMNFQYRHAESITLILDNIDFR